MVEEVTDQQVTIKEAARLTGRTVRTIQRWIDEGHVHASTGYNNRGQPVRFVSRMELEKWAESRDDETTTHDVSPGPARPDGTPVRGDDARAMIERYLATMQTQAEALRDAQERLDTAVRDMAAARERAAVAETRFSSIETRVKELEELRERERIDAERRLVAAQGDALRAEAELTETRRVLQQQAGQGRPWWRPWARRV